MASPARLAAIYQQLNRALDEFRESKSEYVAARVSHHASREKFTGLRKLAQEMIPEGEWYQWQEQHPDVRFMGMGLGEAITAALNAKAIDEAWDVANGVVGPNGKPKVFNPHMTVDALVATLEAGGFEFRSITPKREVNAALLKLEGVVKNEWLGHKKGDADEILARFKSYAKTNSKAEAATSTVAPADDDDVPF